MGGYPGDDEKGAAAFRNVDGPKMTEDFVASARWLKARPESNGKLGAIGFCFGGGIPAFEAALKANNKSYTTYVYELERLIPDNQFRNSSGAGKRGLR